MARVGGTRGERRGGGEKNRGKARRERKGRWNDEGRAGRGERGRMHEWWRTEGERRWQRCGSQVM